MNLAMNLSWVQFGSLMMFLAITLGAFGSHALKEKISADDMEIFKTGIFYHIIHALALFVVAWLTTISADPKVQFAGLFFIGGIFFFSGSLYLLSITEIKALAFITPIGGLLFLFGWFLLLHAQYNKFL